MKRVLALLTCVCLLLSVAPISAWAESSVIDSGSCGEGVNYVLYADGELVISGEGAMADYTQYYTPQAPWYDYQESITSVVIEDGVTSIGNNAFFVYKNLANITISDSVTSIGDGAFSGCSNLTNVVIPNSVVSIGSSAFSGCTGLTEVVIPNSVTSIGDGAFQGCSNLTNVVIPNSVVSIGSGAFSNCTSLTEIVIPDSVTSMGHSVFSYCTSLASVTISNSVTDIREWAFSNCTSLTEVVIPNSVTSLGIYAFSNCTNLTEIVIPNSVTSIGGDAFSNCTSLTEVVIPNSVTTLNGFSNCTSLREIVIPNSVTSIGGGAFSNCTSLTEISIPDSVVSIGGSAFSGCTGLTEITIPANVIDIGSRVFSGCSNLTSVVVDKANPAYSSDAHGVLYNKAKTTLLQAPSGLTGAYTIANGVTNIASNAFYECRGLTQITIPASVTSIDDGAFLFCSSLTNVTFQGNAPSFNSSMWVGCFDGVTATVYYPCGDDTWTEDVMQNYGGTLTWEMRHTNFVNGYCDGCGYDERTYVDAHIEVLYVNTAGEDAAISLDVQVPENATYRDLYNMVQFPDADAHTTSLGALTGWKMYYNGSSLDDAIVPPALGNTYLTLFAAYEYINGWYTIGYAGTDGDAVSFNEFTPIPSGSTIGQVLATQTLPDCGYDFQHWCILSSAGDTYILKFMAYACYDGLVPLYVGVRYTTENGESFYENKVIYVDTLDEEAVKAAILRETNAMEDMRPVGTVISSYTFDTLRLDHDVQHWDEVGECCYVLSASVSVACDTCDHADAETIPGQAATCTEAGWNSYIVCSRCGYTNYEEIPAQHNYVDSRCTVCGAVESIASGTCGADGDNLTWTLDASGTLTISGEGAMADYAQYYPDSDRAPWYVHQKDITSVVIEDGVTTIGNNAFVDCKNLTNVTIGDSVTSIGDGAFSQCNNLVSVNIPDSVTTIGTFAFNHCTSLKEIVIPDSVTTIAAGMFHSCSGLQEITIPDSVTSIGGSAFMGCSSLTEVAIPSNVTAIDGRAFYRCSSLTSVTIPDGVTTIGEEAFYYCTSLKEIVIPNSVTSIGTNAFDSCSSLTSVNIPDSVTSIGDSAFSYCSGLTSVTIPDSLTSIPSGAFSHCSSLTSVNIPESVTSISNGAFSYCTGLTEIMIPANVIAIGNGAFRGCSSLTGIWVDEANLVYSSDAYGVLFNKEKTTLLEAPGALAGEYTIADSATNISDSAFFECSSLTKIIIPASVMTVGESAFYRCSNLINVTFQGNAPSFVSAPMVGGMIFSGVTATVYYPCGDGTWTEDVMKDYYGTLTWEMYHTNFVNGYCDGCDYDERVYYDANISLLYLDTNNEYGVINTTVRVPENATYQDLYDMVQFPAANAHSDSLGALTGWDLYYDGKSLSDTVVPVSYGGAPTVSFSLYAAYEYENFKYTVYYLDEKGEVASQSAQTLIPIGITFEEMLNTLNIPTYNYEQTHWFITGKGDPYYNSVTAAACYDGWFPVHVSASYTAENGDRTGRLGKFLYVDTLEEEAVKSAILKDLQSTELICPVGTVFSGYSFSYLQLTHNVVQDAMRGTACNGLFAEVSLDVVACPEHEFQNHVCVHCRYDDRTYYDANISLLYLDANDEYVQINTTVRVPETATYQDLYDMVQFPAANAHAASLGVLTDWDLYYEGKSLSDTVVPVSYGGTPTISFSLIAAYEYVNFIYTVYYLDEKGEVTSQSAETLMPVGVTFEEMLNTLNIPTYGYKQTHWSSLSKGEAYHNYVTAAICYDGLIPLRVAARYTAEDGDNLVMTYKYVYTDTQDEATVKSAVLQMLQASEDVCPVGRVISDYSFSSLQLTHNVSQDDRVGTSCIGLYADVTVETVTCTEHNFKNGACAHCYITCKELGHDEQQHSGKAATCTTGGWKAYVTCSRCDYTTYKEIAALGHKMTKVPAKAATYTTNGNVEYYICSGCNKLFADAMGERVISAVDTVIAKLPTVVIEKEENKGDSGDTITETPKVEVKVEVKAEAIDEVIVKAAEEAKENKDAPVVVIDVKKEVVETIQKEDSAIKEEQIKVAEVSIPTATVEKVAELNKKSTLAVNLTTATVIMDNKAMEAVVEQANGDSVSLKVNSMEVANLNENQQAAVSGKKIALTISAELICDESGEKLATKDAKGFGGGEVTMAVPLPEELPENVKASDLKVYFISDDGKMEHVSSKLDENGNIIITLKHFSEYVITADALETSTAPVTGDNTNVVLYCVLTIMAVMGMAVVLKKKAF